MATLFCHSSAGSLISVESVAAAFSAVLFISGFQSPLPGLLKLISTSSSKRQAFTPPWICIATYSWFLHPTFPLPLGVPHDSCFPRYDIPRLTASRPTIGDVYTEPRCLRLLFTWLRSFIIRHLKPFNHSISCDTFLFNRFLGLVCLDHSSMRCPALDLLFI